MKEPQQTILSTTNSSNRADFTKSDFDRIVTEKGRLVVLEKALRCPCKGASAAHLTSCRNCGGTGWIFINPRESRMVLQGIEVVTKLEGWSEENRGMARVTGLAEDRISFMDKITIEDEGTSTYTEVLSFSRSEDIIFSFTAYPIEKIEYVGLFNGVNLKLTILEPEVDYTIVGNTFRLNEAKYGESTIEDLSVSIRYEHKPVFYVIEVKRDTMQSFKLIENGSEVSQLLPLSAYARRAHYVLNATNLAGNKLLDNSYVE